MKSKFNWPGLVVVLGVLFCLYAAWNWSAWRHKAWIANGYGARIACSCRYVEGRQMTDCARDMRGLSGMGLVHLSDDLPAKAVHASVPLLGGRSARLAPGFGCVLDSD
jgi:hypothetical protein